MKWKIDYYNESVRKDILTLPKSLLARYFRMTDLMEEFGPHLGAPHTKAFGGGLYEIRLKSQDGIARVFFCLVVDHTITVLHSFIKKDQKTPLRELDVAKKRLKEVKNER